MPEDLKGSYSLLVSTDIFQQLPHFAVQIATCLHLWSEVEHALADVVFTSPNTEPSVAVRDYFSVFTASQRIAHVRAAVAGSGIEADFAALSPELAKLAAERAKIAHGRWGYRIHTEDEILLFPHVGERFFKGKEASIWTLDDFDTLARRLQAMASELADLDNRFVASTQQRH